jgi:hypothetical protein
MILQKTKDSHSYELEKLIMKINSSEINTLNNKEDLMAVKSFLDLITHMKNDQE